MVVELERVDGVEDPVLIPGNPVKLSKVAEGPETRVAGWASTPQGVLQDELGLTDDELDGLVEGGVIGR